MYDLTITGGTVVDGTGDKPVKADIGIKDGKIVEVRRRDGDDAGLQGEAAQTIDATGRIVTPGFVDIHTHLDAQLAWDPDATSSCWMRSVSRSPRTSLSCSGTSHRSGPISMTG